MIVLGWIVFGGFVGWLAGFFIAKPQNGCLVNIALGLVGALAGGFLFQALTGGGFSYETSGAITSPCSACSGNPASCTSAPMSIRRIASMLEMTGTIRKLNSTLLLTALDSHDLMGRYCAPHA